MTVLNQMLAVNQMVVLLGHSYWITISNQKQNNFHTKIWHSIQCSVPCSNGIALIMIAFANSSEPDQTLNNTQTIFPLSFVKTG